MARVRIGPAIPDRKTLDVEIARLRNLDIGALRARWHTLFGRRPPPHLPRHLLFRVLAYNGHAYHGMREANYAAELDLRVRAGDLKEWQRQVPIELRVNGQKVCTYTIDFVETDKNDNVMYNEIKGFETPEWRLKNLFDATH